MRNEARASRAYAAGFSIAAGYRNARPSTLAHELTVMTDTPRPHIAGLPEFPPAQQAQTSKLNENPSNAPV